MAPFLELGGIEGKFPYCQMSKAPGMIRDYGANGREISETEIKVKYFSGVETFFGPGQFMKEFQKRLKPEDLRKVVKMKLGATYYANLPTMKIIRP